MEKKINFEQLLATLVCPCSTFSFFYELCQSFLSIHPHWPLDYCKGNVLM